MRQTANYQLPLWDAADRILREDFNGCNQKIDTAIRAARTEAANATLLLRGELPIVRLADVSTSAAAQQVDVSLAGQNFLQYRGLELEVLCPAAKTIVLRINNSSRYSPGTSVSTVTYLGRLVSLQGEYPSGRFRFNLPIQNLHVFCDYKNTSPGSTESNVNHSRDVLWQNLSSINLLLEDGTAVPAGTKIRAYGVRV